MDEAEAIAASLSPLERKAMIPLTFFSDRTGAALIRKGLFASNEGWPMTKLGGRVSKIIQREATRLSKEAARG